MGVHTKQSMVPKLIRISAVIILAFIMALLGQLTGMHEFIFPEGISVVLGIWAAKKQPWRVNKLQLFFMMIVGAVCAVCIVRYIQIPLIFQVMIGFALVGISILVTRTSFAPVVSAFMLPILLQTDSWYFPLVVVGYMVIMLLVQSVFQKTGLTEKTQDTPTPFKWKKELLHWGILWAIFSILALYPTLTHNIYFMVPPLIITFVEMADRDSHARKSPFKVYLIMALATWIGTGWRFLSIYTPVPTYVTLPLALITLIIVMEFLRFPFAAAGSLVVLPLVFPADTLIWYPVQAMIGLLIFALIPLLIFRNNKMPPHKKLVQHEVETAEYTNISQYSN